MPLACPFLSGGLAGIRACIGSSCAAYAADSKDPSVYRCGAMPKSPAIPVASIPSSPAPAGKGGGGAGAG